MADNWYYVQKGNRHGPVAVEVIDKMISDGQLRSEDFVWKKGFENWKKLKDVSELAPKEEIFSPQSIPLPPQAKELNEERSLGDLGQDDKCLFIRIGADRGEPSSEYGPFSLSQLKQLFKENRINGKTFLFIKGGGDWKMLADYPEYQSIFEELPPLIKESERRGNARRPFIARLFIQNNKQLYEGICRDISIGGMQILVDNFKGQAGDRITINVHPENSDYHFTASGVVVRILEGGAGFSFRFNGLSDEARRSIEKYLQQN
jgi:hypothetical protein